MAETQKDIKGVLLIRLIEGDTKTISLTFKTRDALGAELPLDLRTFSAIRMDVKNSKDTNGRPFISFTLNEGFSIGGENFNVLVFSFSQQFTGNALTSWFYDIKFNRGEEVNHYIEGLIVIDKSVTK